MAKEMHMYHKPTQEGLEKIAQIRAKVIELDDLLDKLSLDPAFADAGISDGTRARRSLAIAKGKLEEFRHRAIEALVFLHNTGEA